MKQVTKNITVTICADDENCNIECKHLIGRCGGATMFCGLFSKDLKMVEDFYTSKVKIFRCKKCLKDFEMENKIYN